MMDPTTTVRPNGQALGGSNVVSAAILTESTRGKTVRTELFGFILQCTFISNSRK